MAGFFFISNVILLPHKKNTRIHLPKVSYNTIIEYIKNLFPKKTPITPSDNPQLDADTLAYVLTDKFYTVANGHRYWYGFADSNDIALAKYVLHSNGVMATTHNSRFYHFKQPVLRIRTSKLANNPQTQSFINNVMESDIQKTNEARIKNRIQLINQKIK